MSSRPRIPCDAAKWFLCGIAVLAVALAAHFFGLTLCPLKRLAGIPCPSCGATRACLALLRGDVRSALAIQPYTLLALAALAACVLFPRLRALAAALWRRPAGKVLFALPVLASWIHNILRGN